MRCNASCWSESLIIQYPFSYSNLSITQLGILAHAFPPSRARSLAFATFASGSALGAAIGNVMGGALTEFTQYEFSESRALRFLFYFHQPV